MFQKYCAAFQKYCVVFQELFVAFADMGHRRQRVYYITQNMKMITKTVAGRNLVPRNRSMDATSAFREIGPWERR